MSFHLPVQSKEGADSEPLDSQKKSDPRVVKEELGEGRPLEGSVRSHMESAFARDFSHVRTHTDDTAAGLSKNMDARAFTVGRHVAFGTNQFKPGTITGDALIAHELGHVVQQSSAGESSESVQESDTAYNRLEQDADQSAGSAVVSLWSKGKKAVKNLAGNAVPAVRSGLRLQRCDENDIDESKAKEKAPAAEKETAPEGEAAPEETEKAEETEAEKTKREVASVKSLNIEENLKGAVKGAGGQLEKTLKRRTKAIKKALEEVLPYKGQKWADDKIAALEADLAKDLDKIIEVPDSKFVLKKNRDDIIEAHKNLTGKEKKLTAGKEAWHKYDDVFAGEKVVATLKTKGFTPAELKALVAQESGDLTITETKGNIAGIAQMGSAEAKEVGAKPEDRLVAEKAIPIAAKVLIKKAEQLETALRGRGLGIPGGEDYKKFVFASYNAGATTIAKSAEKAKALGRDETSWAELIKGGDKSPLYHGISVALAGVVKPADKYKETSGYVERIFRRLQ